MAITSEVIGTVTSSTGLFADFRAKETRLADPISGLFGGAAADAVLGAAVGGVRAAGRKTSLSWRIASAARNAAAQDGYRVSLKALRLVTRESVVKRALRTQRPADVAEAKRLLIDVEASHADGGSLNAETLYSLLRDGYILASEQPERDLTIRQEMNAGFDSLTSGGAARESLWQANLALISPPLATDLQTLRTQYGDPIDRLLQEIVHAHSRPETLRSWSRNRPAWIPGEGAVLGWLGELAFEVDAKDAALLWFSAAIAAGAAPTEYWRVRRLLVDAAMTEQEKIDSIADIATHPLVSAITKGEFVERLAALEEWTTYTAMQASIKASIKGDFLVTLARFEEAIEHGQESFRQNSFSGAAIHAAEAYLRRSGHERGDRVSDLSAALDLALAVRDARRAWGLSSGSTVAKAIKASMMLSNVDRAISLARTPAATAAEIAHPDVRKEAAVALSLLGEVAAAKELLDTATPNWIRLQVESREAELLEEHDRANSLLSEAIDQADDWNEKAQLAFRLAMRGQVHSFVEELRENNSQTVEEIELIAGLYSKAPEAEARARARMVERPTIAFALISYLESSGRPRDVIFVAEQVAEAWSDPELWLKAARTHLAQKSFQSAIDQATKALGAGGAAWGNRAEAYIVQVEAAAASSDWPSALASVQSLLRIQPKSESARWALVRIRRNSGDVDQAFLDWKAGRPGPKPRDRDEASLWLDLFRVNGSQMGTVQELWEIAQEYSHDRQVRNLALGALAMAPITEPIGELNVYALVDQFEREFPGDNAMWKVEVDLEDPQKLLQQLSDAIGPRREGMDVLDEAVRLGRFPIGIAAEPAGKRVAELLNRRHKSPRFAGSLVSDEQDKAVAAALSSGVVIDVTALFTLTLLTEEHANLLISKFPSLTATTEQMIDANVAREVFGREAGGTVSASRPDELPVAWLNDPIEHGVQRKNSVRLVEWFKRTNRRSGLPLTSDVAKQLSMEDDTWSTALDLAAKNGMALWCDDAATRLVATEAGAATFGTPALVEHLRRSEVLGTRQANGIDADLVHNWTVGVVYRQEVFDAAGKLDQMAPQGLAAAILHGGSGHAVEKLNLIMRAAAANAEMPDQLSEWVRVAFRFLGEATIDPAAMFQNHVTLIHRLLVQPWMSPSCLVFVVAAGKPEASVPWADAFQTAFRRMFEQVSRQSDRATASRFALGLVAELESAERQLGLEVVLAP